jgi:hypothetical protein
MIKCTAKDKSPDAPNLTRPSTLDVVTFFKITVTFCPAGVFPIFTAVAVAIGANLKSLGKSYENIFSLPALTVELFATSVDTSVSLDHQALYNVMKEAVSAK